VSGDGSEPIKVTLLSV